jgi:prepilin-type N-terminal cleavage/methylation domain-containing protein
MKNPKQPPGFTLIEMITVMTIIVLLAGIVVGSMGYVQGRQAREKAKAQIALLSKAIEEYKMDMGVYPGDEITTSPPGGYFGGQSANTEQGDHTNALYRALFYEGWNFIEKEEGNNFTSRKIYLVQLDPRDNKQGWVEKVAANGEVKPDLKILDPWGNAYLYRRGTSAQNPDFDLWSTGKDGLTQTGNSDAQLKHKDNRDDIRNF